MNIYVESCANSSYRTEQVCSVLRRDADREGCGRCRFSDLNPNNVCHDIIVCCSLPTVNSERPHVFYRNKIKMINRCDWIFELSKV